MTTKQQINSGLTERKPFTHYCLRVIEVSTSMLTFTFVYVVIYWMLAFRCNYVFTQPSFILHLVMTMNPSDLVHW